MIEQRRRPNLSREKIVAAALQLSRDVDFDNVSFRAVAARLNVSPMAIYKHIENKQELDEAVALELFKSSWTPIARQEGWSWQDWIVAISLDMFGKLIENPVLIDLFVRFPGAPEHLEAQNLYYTALEAGNIGVHRRKDLVSILTSLIAGSTIIYRAGGPEKFENLGNLVIQGLKDHPGQYLEIERVSLEKAPNSETPRLERLIRVLLDSWALADKKS